MSGKVLKCESSLGKYSLLLLLPPVGVMQFVLKLGGRGRLYCYRSSSGERGYVSITVDISV